MRRGDVPSRSPVLVLIVAMAAFVAGAAAIVVVALLGNSVL
jgi:hypothetical protein